ncbi:MAG: hypothetical protein U1D67_03990, partial [Dehalococcoidia bacterium]|nr:hypothetical protein [Dehalococcoidia bacterium]
TPSDGEGYFIFQNLATDPSFSYQVTVNFQSADYTSEKLTFREGEISKFVGTNVYDSTTDVSKIKVSMAHSLVYAENESLEVLEFYLIVNESDKTYIGQGVAAPGGKTETLKFSMPDGVTAMQPMSGLRESRIFKTDAGFIDTMPVLPGPMEVVFSYVIENKSPKYTFSRDIHYPTKSYQFLVQSNISNIESDELTNEGIMEQQGNSFKRFSAKDLIPGEKVVARFSGLPRSGGTNRLQWVISTMAILIAGGAAVYLFRRRRPQPVPAAAAVPELAEDRLLIEIAGLDDDFEAGVIPEEIYRKLREEKKALLIKLRQRPGKV